MRCKLGFSISNVNIIRSWNCDPDPDPDDCCPSTLNLLLIFCISFGLRGEPLSLSTCSSTRRSWSVAILNKSTLTVEIANLEKKKKRKRKFFARLGTFHVWIVTSKSFRSCNESILFHISNSAFIWRNPRSCKVPTAVVKLHGAIFAFTIPGIYYMNAEQRNRSASIHTFLEPKILKSIQ